MDDAMKIVKSLEDSGLLLKGVTKTSKNETKEQKNKEMFFQVWHLCTLGNNLLGKLLLGGRAIRTRDWVTRGCNGMGKVKNFKCCLILLTTSRYIDMFRMNITLQAFIK